MKLRYQSCTSGMMIFFTVFILITPHFSKATVVEKGQDFCRAIFKVFFPSNPIIAEISDPIRKKFQSTIHRAETDLPYLRLMSRPNGLNEEIFWWKISELDPEIQKYLIDYPPDQAKQRKKYFTELSYEFEKSNITNSFLSNCIEYLSRDFIFSGSSFSSAAQKKLITIEQLKKKQTVLDSWIQQWNLLVRRHHAMNWWNLALEVPVDSHTYKSYLHRGSLRLRVPSELISHPAWNPLNHKHLVKMMRDGVQPPDQFLVELGHDGRFYLMDGNHRFEVALRNGQKSVEVELLENKLVTMPLKRFLDCVGITQPTPDQILKFYEDRNSLDQFIENNPYLKKNIILR